MAIHDESFQLSRFGRKILSPAHKQFQVDSQREPNALRYDAWIDTWDSQFLAQIADISISKANSNTLRNAY